MEKTKNEVLIDNGIDLDRDLSCSAYTKIRFAMEEYAALQNKELKEELHNLKSEYSSRCIELGQLEEVADEMAKAVEFVITHGIQTDRSGGAKYMLQQSLSNYQSLNK